MEQARMSGAEARDLLAQAVSPQEFAGFVRAHQAAVRGWLLRALRDPAAADDLAQEVFLHAYQRKDEYRGEGVVQAWLLGIARNLARQHVRAAKRRHAREQGPLQVQLAQWRMERLERDPWDDAEQEQAFLALRGCIDGLPPENQRVVREHYFERRKIAAIAARMDRAGGAVRMMLFRIRRALGDCLRAKLERPA